MTLSHGRHGNDALVDCDNVQVKPFHPVGAEIVGLDLSSSASSLSLSTKCRDHIFQIWNDHQVVLIRNQNLTESTLLEFATYFGTPKPAGSRGYYMRAGNPHGSGRSSSLPQVSVMSNMDEFGNPLPVTGGHGSQAVDWHQDDSYTNTPARGALLYNTVHPVNGGGNTSFCNLYLAYETLDEELQSYIEQLHLVHDISRNSAGHVRPGLTLPQTYDEIQGPAHPLVITHPLTGRKALHLGRKQPSPSSYILELPNRTGHELFSYLWEHATSTSMVWTHDTWRPGDLIVWDNLATMHARSLVDPNQKREMLRVLLRGPQEGLVGAVMTTNNNVADEEEQHQLRTVFTTANDRADSEAVTKDFGSFRDVRGDGRVAEAGLDIVGEAVFTSALFNGTCDGNTAATCNVDIDVSNNISATLMKRNQVSPLASAMILPSDYSILWLGLYLGLLAWCIYGNRGTGSTKSDARGDKTPFPVGNVVSNQDHGQTTTKTEMTTTTTEVQEVTSEGYLSEPRVQVFWCCFLGIYLFFQSFSCGRADRLWRISDLYNASPPVLLKPYGISYLWYESIGHYIALVENIVLVCMVALVIPCGAIETLSRSPSLKMPRRWLALVCGAGWLILHSYEHSLTGGSHTHLMPAICMMALALPPQQSLTVIRWWNMFLLFSAGLCKLFNGDHHPWYAWMDGQSMQFYFVNSRQAVPEPFYSWTMNNDWFAAAQATGSVIFELSTCLLFWRPYRLYFPLLGAAFHGMIWYTLGVNYLTSVVIQFTLVLDAEDWKHFLHKFLRYGAPLAKAERTEVSKPKSGSTGQNTNYFARAMAVINPVIMAIVIVRQIEFWPLSNIPMYSGYRPRVGYNTTHIMNKTYLDHLVNECAPHVWSRLWTDVMIIDKETNERSKMQFCTPHPTLGNRAVKDLCLIPQGRLFDTERGNPMESYAYRLDPPIENANSFKNSMRVGGWNRQKPIVALAELPGRYHVYCQHDSLSPAEDWLHRNCAFVQSFPQMANKTLQAELVIHLGTGDLVVGTVDCDDYSYPVDRVPPCPQMPS